MKNLFVEKTTFANQVFASFVPQGVDKSQAIFELAKKTTFAKDLAEVDLTQFISDFTLKLQEVSQENMEKFCQKAFTDFFKLGLPNANAKEIKVLYKILSKRTIDIEEVEDRQKEILTYCEKFEQLKACSLLFKDLQKANESATIEIKNFSIILSVCHFFNRLMKNEQLTKQFVAIDYFSDFVMQEIEEKIEGSFEETGILGWIQEKLNHLFSRFAEVIPFSLAGLQKWSNFSISCQELLKFQLNDETREATFTYLTMEEKDIEFDYVFYQHHDSFYEHNKISSGLEFLKNLSIFSFETLCNLAEKYYLSGAFKKYYSALQDFKVKDKIDTLAKREETCQTFEKYLLEFSTESITSLAKKLTAMSEALDKHYNGFAKKHFLKKFSQSLFELLLHPFFLCTVTALLKKECVSKDDLIKDLIFSIAGQANEQIEEKGTVHFARQESEIIYNTLLVLEENKAFVNADFVEETIKSIIGKDRVYVLSKNHFPLVLGLSKLTKYETLEDFLKANEKVLKNAFYTIESICIYDVFKNLSATTKEVLLAEIYHFLMTKENDGKSNGNLTRFLKNLSQTSIGSNLTHEQFLKLLQVSIEENEHYFEGKQSYMLENNLKAICSHFSPCALKIEELYKEEKLTAVEFRTVRDIVLKMQSISQLLLLAVENTTDVTKSEEVKAYSNQLLTINERAKLINE